MIFVMRRVIFTSQVLSFVRILEVPIQGTSNSSVLNEPREDFSSGETKFARVVGATRRNFVKYDGKDASDSSASEFLEVSYK